MAKTNVTKKPTVQQIITLLTKAYGKPECQIIGNPLDVLVQTILSQNTSDINSGRAFKSLKSVFADWESAETASENIIAAAIRVGGLEEIKARRIKQALKEIRQRRGELELDFLAELPVSEARTWLIELPGVGMKTANCVLLFALGMAALPVDTHVHRVSQRLGLVSEKASADKAHVILEELVPPEQVYQFHVLFIEHGRRVCKAQRPNCDECAVAEICPSNNR